MKKILFSINTFLVGGIEKTLIELLKNKRLESYDITLLIGYNLGELEKLKSEIPKNIKIKYIFDEEIYTRAKKKKVQGKLKKYEKVLDESFSWLKKIIFNKRLSSLIKNYDVLIDYDMTLASYAKDIKIKKIAYCHFSLFNYNRGIKSRQEKLGKRLDDYNNIVVISDDMKKEAVELFPFLKSKVVKIYNSFDIEDIQIKAKKVNEKDRDLLKQNYILAVGRLEETQKDFTTLIKAYSLIANEVNEKLYILGDGRHKTQLETLVKELKLENKVIFLGFRKNPYCWMKNANLFVHSSKFEGLPTVLIEALILEVPIIATDCPTGPREILENGKDGILVKIGDYNKMSESINYIFKNEEIKKQFLENSKKSVRRFDGRIVIKQLEELL